MKITFLERELKKDTLEISNFNVAYLMAIKGNNPNVWDEFVRIVNHIDKGV